MSTTKTFFLTPYQFTIVYQFPTDRCKQSFNCNSALNGNLQNIGWSKFNLRLYNKELSRNCVCGNWDSFIFGALPISNNCFQTDVKTKYVNIIWGDYIIITILQAHTNQHCVWIFPVISHVYIHSFICCSVRFYNPIK